MLSIYVNLCISDVQDNVVTSMCGWLLIVWIKSYSSYLLVSC